MVAFEFAEEEAEPAEPGDVRFGVDGGAKELLDGDDLGVLEAGLGGAEEAFDFLEQVEPGRQCHFLALGIHGRQSLLPPVVFNLPPTIIYAAFGEYSSPAEPSPIPPILRDLHPLCSRPWTFATRSEPWAPVPPTEEARRNHVQDLAKAATLLRQAVAT